MKRPYLIAEIGVNHSGDRECAARMIHAAADAGADAVKFQYYRADRLAAKESPTYFGQIGERARTQREFFARYDALRPPDYEWLATVAKDCGVDFGCTVFQPEDVAWVNPLVQWHKVASADIDNWQLLTAAARYGKRVLLSTGAATRSEAIRALERLVAVEVVPMHCVLEYPTPLDHAGLHHIRYWKRYFDGAGYSDHCLFNLDVLTTAWLLGAHYIEKHFTLDKTTPGNDHYHSMDPADLLAFRRRIDELLPLLGDGDKSTIPPHEQAAYREARRSLYAAHDLPAGHLVTQGDVDYLRPAHGLRPGQEAVVVGKRTVQDVPKETLWSPELVA